MDDASLPMARPRRAEGPTHPRLVGFLTGATHRHVTANIGNIRA